MSSRLSIALAGLYALLVQPTLADNRPSGWINSLSANVNNVPSISSSGSAAPSLPGVAAYQPTDSPSLSSSVSSNSGGLPRSHYSGDSVYGLRVQQESVSSGSTSNLGWFQQLTSTASPSAPSASASGSSGSGLSASPSPSYLPPLPPDQAVLELKIYEWTRVDSPPTTDGTPGMHAYGSPWGFTYDFDFSQNNSTSETFVLTTYVKQGDWLAFNSDNWIAQDRVGLLASQKVTVSYTLSIRPWSTVLGVAADRLASARSKRLDRRPECCR
jgi:hypothetical protein